MKGLKPGGGEGQFTSSCSLLKPAAARRPSIVPAPESPDANNAHSNMNNKQFADACCPRITTANMCTDADHPRIQKLADVESLWI